MDSAAPTLLGDDEHLGVYRFLSAYRQTALLGKNAAWQSPGRERQNPAGGFAGPGIGSRETLCSSLDADCARAGASPAAKWRSGGYSRINNPACRGAAQQLNPPIGAPRAMAQAASPAGSGSLVD